MREMNRNAALKWAAMAVGMLTFGITAQAPIKGENNLINVNPDVNGEPWIAGGITKDQWNAAIAGLKPLVITHRTVLGKTALAAPRADNTAFPAFRPVFNQQGGSCSQASSIGYAFTYEINTLRGAAGNVPGNQYPYDFSYNFLNSGDGTNGAMPNQAFDIAKALGIPNVTSYGGFGLGKFTQWISGYNVYFNGMANRAADQFTIKVNTAAGINTMREWISNHGNGSAQGGCLVFCYDATGAAIGTLAANTPEAGKKVLYANGNGGGHSVTIAGYDDSVRFDYNNDGRYTNTVDISGNGSVGVEDWEIGAIIMVNSWGTSFGNSGKIYIPYGFCANGMWSSTVYGMRTGTDTVKPVLTYKVTMSHSQRNQSRIRAGYANSASATAPTTTKSFAGAFNYCGGAYPIQGINSDSIEIGLDVSDFMSGLTGSDASLFLLVDSKGGSGKVQKFSLLDYTGGPTPVEVVCSQKNVTIVTGTTTLKIAKTLAKILVLTPNGGEKWERGRTFPITWFDRLSENVKIELLKSAAVVSTISASAPSTGVFQWQIPADQTIGADYKVRITSISDTSATDASDNNFSITEKSILVLTSPVGGEYLEKGKPAAIAWNSVGPSAVTIDLYENRIFDTTIAANVPNTGSYTWNIPTTLPSAFEYSIRITSNDNSWLYDESKNYFAIVYPIVMAPYSQNFDAFKDSTTVLGSYWEQGVDDDIDWTVWKGPTPSKTNISAGGGGTGPNGDHTSGNGQFIYLEASSPNHPGKTGVLLSPAINVSSLTNVQIGLWCHMYSKGGNMGELWMDINVDGSWKDSVLYLTNDHGDQWFQNTVRLSQVPTVPASPKRMQVRFRGRTGLDYDSDICLDDFSITGTTVSAAPADVFVSMTRSRIMRIGSILKFNNVNGAIKIFTLNGVKVANVPVKGSGIVDISMLPQGTYVVRGGDVMTKFVRY